MYDFTTPHLPLQLHITNMLHTRFPCSLHQWLVMASVATFCYSRWVGRLARLHVDVDLHTLFYTNAWSCQVLPPLLITLERATCPITLWCGIPYPQSFTSMFGHCLCCQLLQQNCYQSFGKPLPQNIRFISQEVPPLPPHWVRDSETGKHFKSSRNGTQYIGRDLGIRATRGASQRGD